MSIWLQKSASIQKRTSAVKFDHLAENSEKGSISNLSTKEPLPEADLRARVEAAAERQHEHRGQRGARAGSRPGNSFENQIENLIFLKTKIITTCK